MKLKLVIAFAGLLLALPLSSPAQSAASNPSPAVDGSQPQFQVIDGHKSNLVRADPSADWASYKQIRFEPVAYEPSDPDHRLNTGQASKITSSFAASLDSAFRKVKSGEGAILRVTPIITKVKRTNTVINLISFAAVQMPASYGGASVRYELVDDASGKTIGEITSCRNARPWNVYPWNLLQNFEALGQSSVILKSDARTLRRDLDRLSKLSATQTAPTTGE
jgi:hypothetical protein